MRPGRLLEWLADAAVRRPRSALLVAMLGCLLLASPALSLKLEVDLVRLLPDGLPAVERFRELADTFGANDQAFVAVEINDPTRHDDTALRIRARAMVDEVARELLATRWTPPSGEAVPLVLACDGRGDPGWSAALLDQLGAETWRFLDDRHLDQLIKRLQPRVVERRLALGPPPDLPAEIADRDLLTIWRDCYLPFWQDAAATLGPVRREGGYLVGQGGRFHLLMLRPSRPAHNRDFTIRFTNVLNAIAGRVAADPANAGLAIHTAGGHFIAAADYHLARNAAAGNLWQGIVSVAVVLALAFRSWRVPVLVVAALLPATAAAFGAARLLCGPEVSLVVAAFTAALIGLGDDVLIHLLSAFGRHVGNAGASAVARAEAAGAAAREIANSVFAGIATTVAAIAVLGLSDFRGLRQLGAMGAAGLAIILVQLFVVVPAALTLWGGRIRQPSAAAYAKGLPKARWALLLALLALGGWAVFSVRGDGPLFRFDSDGRALRPAHDPVFAEQVRLGRELGLPLDELQFLVSGVTREAVAESGARLLEIAASLGVPSTVVLDGGLGAQLPEAVAGVGIAACAGPRIVDTPAGRLRVERVEAGRLSGLRWLDGIPAAAVPAGATVTIRPLFKIPPGALALAAPSRQRAVMARLRNEVDWPGVEAAMAKLDVGSRARYGRFIADLDVLRAGVNSGRALTPGDLLTSPLGSAIGAMWSEQGGRVRCAVRVSAPDVGRGLSVNEACAALDVVRDGAAWRDSGASVAASGMLVLGAALRDAVVVDLERLATWAGGAVVVLVLLLVGGLRPALVVLAALVAGMGLTVACMHACNLAWNPMNIAAAPLLLGMSVEAAIFMVHALDRQPRRLDGVVAALREAVIPALLSIGTTILGFATLLLNPYRGVQSLGLLVVIGLSAALFVALVAVPALAALTTHRRRAEPHIDTATKG